MLTIFKSELSLILSFSYFVSSIYNSLTRLSFSHLQCFVLISCCSIFNDHSLPAPRGQLDYYIILDFLCQELFLSFFKKIRFQRDLLFSLFLNKVFCYNSPKASLQAFFLNFEYGRDITIPTIIRDSQISTMLSQDQAFCSMRKGNTMFAAAAAI